MDSSASRNTEVKDRCGNKTAYEYDAAGRTTKVTSKNASGTALANVSYAYDSFDNMTEIVRGDGLKYVLEYNAFHNLESIGINDKSEKLVSYTYKNGSGRLKQITYANGDVMKVTYNSLGQMNSERWYDSADTLTAHYKYVYNGEGNIVRSIDLLGQKEYNYIYEDGRIVRAIECDITVNTSEIVTAKSSVNEIIYTYDSEGKLTKKRIVPTSGTGQDITYTNSDDGNVTVRYTAGSSTVIASSETDALGRKVLETVQIGNVNLMRQFSYHVGEITEEHVMNSMLRGAPTTYLVSNLVFLDGRTIFYDYDGEERITRVDDSIDGTTEYTYDALGQLLTEKVNGTVVNSMTYDNYGNILTKNGVVYTYGDSVWKDKLTAYGEQAISYDAQGNPTTYLGHTLVWEKGRQLKSFDSNQYTYNANGIRTSKTVNGVKHTYTLDGVKILKETWGYTSLTPMYDNEDSICGVIYGAQPYYFQKNLQGDIIAITDKTGLVVARYSYDAWGKCSIVEDTSGKSIASINPYRYRGYYYDTETGLYYLQSRYYDPVVGRFINGDDVMVLEIHERAVDSNLFVYCENRVVEKKDVTGFASTYTYGGIKCTKTKVGFDVKHHYKFALKSFCKTYAKKVIARWGKSGKYCYMDSHRIAAELFAHEVLFIAGIVGGAYSVWMFRYVWYARSILRKIMGIVVGVISGKISNFLLKHTTIINVNYNESGYRKAAFEIIWAFFPPAIW